MLQDFIACLNIIIALFWRLIKTRNAITCLVYLNWAKPSSVYDVKWRSKTVSLITILLFFLPSLSIEQAETPNESFVRLLENVFVISHNPCWQKQFITRWNKKLRLGFRQKPLRNYIKQYHKRGEHSENNEHFTFETGR